MFNDKNTAPCNFSEMADIYACMHACTHEVCTMHCVRLGLMTKVNPNEMKMASVWDIYHIILQVHTLTTTSLLLLPTSCYTVQARKKSYKA